MDFLLINASKLKISLDEKELVEMGIEMRGADYEESCLKGSLTELLERAQDKCGFKLGKERVLVQLYPSDKGADIFITKLSFMSPGERRVINEAQTLSTYSKKQVFFRFDSLSDLISAARAGNYDRIGCDVFKHRDGSFYIRLTEEGLDGILPTDRLAEYGTRISSLPMGIEGEYGSLIIREEGLRLLSVM